MQVLDKPEEHDGPLPRRSRKPTGQPDGQPLLGGGGWWVRGKQTKIGFFAGRAAFVIVGAMLIVMTLISVFMLWVSWNEPYLAPSIVDETLHVNKIYLQYDGETVYHELAMGEQPTTLIADEVTQIEKGRSFKIIFTPKQLDVPEHYQIYLKNSGQEPEGGFNRQSKYLKETIDGTFYTLTVTLNSNAWTPGHYEVVLPDSGMFGGQWYAYFTVADK